MKESLNQKTDLFCYFILVIIPLRYIIGLITMRKMFSVMSYDNIIDGAYLEQTVPGSALLSVLNYLLLVAFIVFVVLDILQIYRQGHRIVGLILFSIFLHPGYYIWRAYILGRKKTGPIIYTVAVCALLLFYFCYIGYQVVHMVGLIMQAM